MDSAPAVAANAATTDEARRFCALPNEAAQRSVLGYPELLRRAVLELAAGAGAEEALNGLMDGCPEMLTTVDNRVYRESPLGHALLRKRLNVCWRFVRTAERHGITSRVLRHRNSSGHTLLMLAVDLDAMEGAAPLMERLLDEWPDQVHTCYDTDGRNVLHHCAADGRATSLAVILGRLSADAADTAAAALGVPDGVERLSPLHYMARSGRLDMLRTVAEFFTARLGRSRPDGDFYARRWPDGRTPAELAQAAGHSDVCRWLAAETSPASPESTPPESVNDDDECCRLTTDSEDDHDDDVADELGRLSVMSSDKLPISRLSESSRRRLSEGLVSRGCRDSQRLAVALAARWPPLADAAKPGGFLSLSADPAALCVSLMAGGGAGLDILAGALQDIDREDLLVCLAVD